MFYLQILFLFLISNKLISSAELEETQHKSGDEDRIIGGSPCSTKQHGYMIQLRATFYLFDGHFETIFLCGATLIKPKWGLTAAHCKDPEAASFEILAAGNKKKPIRRKVKNFYIHPGYKREGSRPNDIAVLELLVSLSENEDGVRFAKLPDPGGPYRDPWCQFGKLIGWGEMKDQLLPKVNQLQCGYIPILPLRKCEQIIYEHVRVRIDLNQICALPKTVDALVGDAGGPLFCRDIQVGVASWGPPYEKVVLYPGVYTRIRSYLNFINGVIGKGTGPRSDDVSLNDTNTTGSSYGENIYPCFVLNNFIIFVLLFLI